MIRRFLSLVVALALLSLVVSGCGESEEERVTRQWCATADKTRSMPSPDLLAPSPELSTTLALTQIQSDVLWATAPAEIAVESKVVADAYHHIVDALLAVQWDGLAITLQDYWPAVSRDVAAASRTLDTYADENCERDETTQPLGLWERLVIVGAPSPGEMTPDATFRDVLVTNVAGEVPMTAEQQACVTSGITQETIDRLVAILGDCGVSFG